MNGSGPHSGVQDFRDILSHPVDGELPLLVGGHAVNLWASVYGERIGRNFSRRDRSRSGRGFVMHSLK